MKKLALILLLSTTTACGSAKPITIVPPPMLLIPATDSPEEDADVHIIPRTWVDSDQLCATDNIGQLHCASVGAVKMLLRGQRNAE